MNYGRIDNSKMLKFTYMFDFPPKTSIFYFITIWKYLFTLVMKTCYYRYHSKWYHICRSNYLHRAFSKRRDNFSHFNVKKCHLFSYLICVKFTYLDLPFSHEDRFCLVNSCRSTLNQLGEEIDETNVLLKMCRVVQGLFCSTLNVRDSDFINYHCRCKCVIAVIVQSLIMAGTRMKIFISTMSWKRRTNLYDVEVKCSYLFVNNCYMQWKHLRSFVLNSIIIDNERF